ncbi:hypothetical protein [Vibrio sp. MA64]|uniref:hypothetical protein n=1 Tax=Vibrio sp. MA64 TaxID=2896365 RepID=UPI001E4EC181|nr:hypothetical protein [Vibrio sp. MA64]ELA9205255.1 hypothetical protein [Vibrio alginolyticus]MCC9654069.1 hypothetical protein [Vibrio sp. MA64]
MLENLIQILLENKEWLFSGVTIVLVSAVANVLTTLFFGRKTTKITIKMSDRDGKVHHISVSSDESEEAIERAIKKIRGEAYKDPIEKSKH